MGRAQPSAIQVCLLRASQPSLLWDSWLNYPTVAALKCRAILSRVPNGTRQVCAVRAAGQNVYAPVAAPAVVFGQVLHYNAQVFLGARLL